MRNEPKELTAASREYAVAYAAQYTRHDLPLALRLYKKLIDSHPNAQEAGYSFEQIQNIVNAVIPKQEQLDAQLELLISRIGANRNRKEFATSRWIDYKRRTIRARSRERCESISIFTRRFGKAVCMFGAQGLMHQMV